MIEDQFPDGIRSLVRDATASAKHPSVALIHERHRNRRRTLTFTAMASTLAAVIALVALLNASGVGSAVSRVKPPSYAESNPTPEPTSSPSTSPSALATAAPPPLQVGTVPLGKAPVSAGPSTPVPLFYADKLLLPGLKALTLGNPRSRLAVSPDATWAAYQYGVHLRAVNFATAEVYDLGIGSDPVWGAPGLAYAVLSQRDDGISPTGLIAVRSQVGAAPVVWAQGQVSTSGWIGTHLLIGLVGKGQFGEVTEPALLDSPLHERPFSDNATGTFNLVAVSPDATHFLIRLQRSVATVQSTYVHSFLELLDVSTLQIIQKDTGHRWDAVSAGSWVGSDLYAGLANYDEGNSSEPPIVYHLHVSNQGFQYISEHYFHNADGVNKYISVEGVWRVAPDQIAVLRGTGIGGELDICSVPSLTCSLKLVVV